MTLRLQEAVYADVDAIAALHAASWCASYRGVLPDVFLDEHVLENRRALWQVRLQSPAADQVVVSAVQGGVLRGFACVYLDADPERGALLDNLHVQPALTGSGIGARLLAEIRARVGKQRPGRGVHLWVFAANTRARRFYERHGGVAREEKTIEVLPGVPVAEVCYALPAQGTTVNRGEPR